MMRCIDISLDHPRRSKKIQQMTCSSFLTFKCFLNTNIVVFVIAYI